MNRIRLVFPLLCLCLNCMAQGGIGYEYWFDQDTDNRQTGQSSDGKVSLSLDVGKLQFGLHSLTLRASDTKGNWSVPASTYFIKTNVHQNGNSIKKYQYWLDGNFNNAITTNATGQTVSLNIDVASLDYGLHTLSFRAQDDWGFWSAPSTHYFIHATPSSENRLTQYEYWIDSNTANLQRVSSDNGLIQLSVDANALDVGLHSISFRMADSRGFWSVPYSSYFLKTKVYQSENKLSEYEYWIDNNTANLQRVSSDNGLIQLNVDASALDEGLHSISFRMADSRGFWSVPYSAYFLKAKVYQSENKLSEYEYWIDYNIEDKQSGSSENGLIQLNLDADVLDEGVHSLTFRMADIRGNWSVPSTHYFVKTNKLANPNLIAGYQYWYNEAGSQATYVALDNPISPAIIDVQLPLNSLIDKVTPENIILMTDTDGSQKIGVKNALHIRFKDMNDQWSAAQTDSFNVMMSNQELDLTAFIKNPDASNNKKDWTVETGYISIETADHYSGQEDKYFRLHNQTSMKQLISGLPAGAYTILCMGRSSGSQGEVSVNGYTSEIIGSDWAQQVVTFTTDGSPFELRISNTDNGQTDIDDIILMNALERQSMTILVTDDHGNDVTSDVSIRWYDTNGILLGAGSSISGLKKNDEYFYSVELKEELGRQYREINKQSIIANTELVRCQLKRIQQTMISAHVVDSDSKFSISGANISICQWLNGKYVQQFTAQTDRQGYFELQVAADSSLVTISYDGYLDEQFSLSSFDNYELGDIALTEASDLIIIPKLSYQSAVDEGEEPQIQSWYDNSDNVAYTVRNLTKNVDLQTSIQRGVILVGDNFDAGDRLSVTASSKDGSFVAVKKEIEILQEDEITVPLLLVENGGINVTYGGKGDEESLAFVYSSQGTMVQRATFSSTSTSFNRLNADTYQLLTMGYDGTMGTVANLSDIQALGLEEGIDYVRNTVVVHDGFISTINVDSVPEMDRSKFSYTSFNTSYLPNKSQFVAGSFVTLTGRVDFKTQYANDVDNILITIDIPEGCIFIDNSVVIGTRQVPYSLSNNKLTIPLGKEDIDNRIRFCMTPTQSGTYTSSAYATFMCNGQKTQSIGSAYFEATDMAITAPSTTNKTIIPVSGVASPKAMVDVYDNGNIIGSLQAQADGRWMIDCDLFKPYNLSTHNIYAKVKGQNGITVTTASKECNYDMNAVAVKSILMTFYNGWLRHNVDVTFDFETGTTSSNNYMFYTATDITFIADLTSNDSTSVRSVTFYVYTSQNEVRELDGFYDQKLGRWVAVSHFDSYNLPVNLMVDLETNVIPLIDGHRLTDIYNDVTDIKNEFVNEADNIDEIVESIDEKLQEETIDYESIEMMLSQLYNSSEEIDEERVNRLADMDTDLLLDSLYIEEEYIKEVIDESEIFSTELISDIRRFSLYSESEFVTDDGLIQGKTTISTCEGIDETRLHESGFNKLPTIDDDPIYETISDNYYCRIDLVNNIKTEIEISSSLLYSTTSTHKSKLRDSEWFGRITRAYNDYTFKIYSNQESLRLLFKTNNQNAAKKLAKLATSKKAINESLAAVNKQLESAFGMKEIKLLAKKKSLTAQKKFIVQEEARITKWVDKLGIALRALESLYNWSEWHKKVMGYAKRVDNFNIPFCAYQYSPKAVEIIENNIDRIQKDFSNYYLKQLGRRAFYDIANVLATPLVGICLAILETESERVRDEQFEKWLKCDIEQIEFWIKNLDCTPDPPEPPKPTPNPPKPPRPQPPFPPLTPIHDPSGFVYEAVPTNRIKDVTATIYYDAEEPKQWDASDYSQVNPIITGEAGLYAWDVPQGMWQVRFEKSGYETSQTDWLPVPPPQMEINIPLQHAVTPQVDKARGTESGIWLTFSKYMKPETLTKSRISVSRNGSNASGDVEMLNSEEDPYSHREYASKVKFVPNKAFATTDEVIVTVKKEVESYADKQMAEDFVQRVEIEPELKAISCDSILAVDYLGETILEVNVLPADAAKGRTLLVESTSEIIATADVSSVMLNEEGKARIFVSGNLPGSTSIHLSIPEAELEYFVEVYVVRAETIVKAPKASKRTGSTIVMDYLLELTSATKGATIYYTLDGTCPCDEQKRILYAGPFALPLGEVTVKAIATRQGMNDSEVSTFHYLVSEQAGIIQLEVSDRSIEARYLDDNILIDGAEGANCYVFDLEGRMLASKTQLGSHATIKVPKTEAYVILAKWPDGKTATQKIISQ